MNLIKKIKWYLNEKKKHLIYVYACDGLYETFYSGSLFESLAKKKADRCAERFFSNIKPGKDFLFIGKVDYTSENCHCLYGDQGRSFAYPKRKTK